MKALARRHRWLLLIPTLVAAWSAGAGAQKPDLAARQTEASGLPERIWRDPGNVAALDMINGVGGKAHAPDPSEAFAFVKEVEAPVTEKFDVVDARGVTWRVKLGDESQPETAATRFMWAAGYFTDEVYYVPKLRVSGLPKLRHAQNQVSPDGIVSGARLERQRDAATKLGEWDWFDNPFVGRREFNGLRVMMALLNSRPQFLGVLDPANYRERTDMEGITRHIPRADVKWLAARLSQLTTGQIRDAFRAAGFDSGEIEQLTRALRLRIAALEAM